MYFTGSGVEQDIEKGASLFLDSAYSGSPIAQYNVGIMNFTGNGLGTTDQIKAYG